MSDDQHFLRIGPITVEEMTCDQGAGVVGIPNVFGIMGFVHKLERTLRSEGLGARFSGTMIIIHGADVQAGQPRLPVDTRGRIENGPRTLDRTFGAMRFSLYIELDFSDDDDLEKSLDTLSRSNEVLCPEILSGRVCGGCVVHFGPNFIERKRRNLRNRIAYLTEIKDLISDLQKLPFGHVIQDRSDLIQNRNSGTDALDAFLDSLGLIKKLRKVNEEGEEEIRELESEQDSEASRDSDVKADQIVFRRNQKGWIIPTTIGYQLLEEPRERRHPRCRSGTKLHAFAESMAGLVECVSSRQITAQFRSNEGVSKFMWRYRFDQEALAGFYTAQTSEEDQL